MFEEERKHKKILTPRQAQLKAESYCAYQERSQQEVRDKLYTWGLHEEDVENVIANLIADNFLNEERFAVAYCTGKLRMKGWGKIKIKQGLKAKKVSEQLIKIAFKQIEPDEYEAILENIIDKKIREIGNKDAFTIKNKVYQFALSRGFESDLIFSILTSKEL
ncbi:regulatory protein RecX [Sphingobacterium thalpophilum]|uniref:Regulatory protein RecX n=1 Tax=Sphingobacterium thalpophilum TaxID=259 RepID=A0A4V6KNA1_9SPHI|nr:regulatory protein RecX [Sphingobacterium thalpophilum]VTR30178.1 recombination regulator RecX [Sphingobacterium thalpophilum]